MLIGAERHGAAQLMLLCRSAGGDEEKNKGFHMGLSSSSCDLFLWREAQVAIKSAASPAPLFLVLQHKSDSSRTAQSDIDI